MTTESTSPGNAGATAAGTVPHPVDARLPLSRLGALGAQHVAVMYTGCVAVPLVFGAAAGLDTRTIGLLVAADLLVAGLVTIVQSLGLGRLFGVRLPVVAGASFTAVTPMITIQGEYGLAAVYGAMLAAGVFGMLIAWPFARLVRYFPPVVRGTAVTIIGLSLVGKAVDLITGDDPEAPDYASGERLGLAVGVVVLIVVLTRFARGFLAQTVVLIGLLAGTGAAAWLGMTDFSAVSGADWFGFPDPFHFGAPEFPLAAVVSMCVVMLVIFAESTAYLLSVGEITGRPVGRAELARGLAADGLSGTVAGAMTSFPDTVFAQNVSLVRMTGVRSRYTVTAAGVLLVLLGLMPKLGETVASLPGPVIGAVSLVMFAMVALTGIRTLSEVRYDGTHNGMIVALALAVGMVPVVAPTIYADFPSWFRIVAGGSISSAVIVAFFLNLFFNHLTRERA
ncbi:nucleobase:cation symporter-2 family protein [Streptomyces sp. MP131-18]|uniref:nucleobase:cation symporter-2 family protein n=1 Tax=Streptomyces sp. MP131-18 TaxID=1857892 RepID=UPI00097BF670|nr:nucleobase:cation symporter-2 family protein [Streptomyces sp. MP131-18]ONK10252.1 Uric acid transporter UacT [Streptomyces sp. MP131-18]